MLPTIVHTLIFLLAVFFRLSQLVAFVGCTGRFDHNIVLSLGWIYLGSKNPHLTESFTVQKLTNFSFISLCLDQLLLMLQVSSQ